MASALASFALSLFIYLETFNIEARALNTLLVPLGILLILDASRREIFMIGFFTGLLWFWWIGLSFRFTDYPFLTPIAAIGVAIVYGALFWLMGFLPLWGRAIGLAFGFLAIEPLSFTWFKPELVLVNSFYSVHKAAFFCLVSAAGCYLHLQRHRGEKWWLIPLGSILLILSFALPTPKRADMPEFRIALTHTEVPQSVKWEKPHIEAQAIDAMKRIDAAIENGYDLIVLPEAVFVMFLNKDSDMMEELLIRSRRIAIVAGALHLKNGHPFNSAYIFNRSKMIIADKVFLVPFGEASPLPEWMGRRINALFFDGATDYQTAEEPTDFTIGGYRFRAAICYEAGIEAMYRDAPPYMIAISNNGWFTPSTEPSFQRLLIRLYARRYGAIVFHSANESPSEIIY
ncbi:MAG: apolipoprotein N-acyltransferase [Helicobacteraceae bacterium]|jgi:apolipoprotein N-acyltransferase|nr:apolipoprotein N-acyltransferase [Helicobacteraceae bacterium]